MASPRSGVFAATAVIATTLAQPALPAPPPPPVMPPAFRQPVDGYDLGPLYTMWSAWIESHKGEAVDQLIAQAEPSAGDRRLTGPPLIDVKRMSSDDGHTGTTQVLSYCRPPGPPAYQPSDCIYHLRSVQFTAEPWSTGNPLSDWQQANFNPPRLVAHLKALGLGPDADWWRENRAAVFADQVSPVPMLLQNAVVTSIDSETCPGFKAAVEALDQRRLDWRADLPGVGADVGEGASPHWTADIITINLRGPVGIPTVLQGATSDLSDLVRPVLAAAGACPRTP